MSSSKSLEQWRLELLRYGTRHWGTFYKEFVGVPPSNFPRFNKTLSLYGDWAMFEAILATSNQNVTGDPLNYVLKTAHNIWKENQKEMEYAVGQEALIKQAIETSHERNMKLAKKLEKARKRKR